MMSRQNHKHIQEVGKNRKAPNKFSADNNLEVTQYATVAKSLQEVGGHHQGCKNDQNSTICCLGWFKR